MLLVALFIIAPVTGWTAKVVVQWDTNTEPNVVGYKIHLGTQTGAYTATNDIGAQTWAQVQNLVAGRTYYFAVTAYSMEGLESDFSEEISYTPPNQAPVLVPISNMTNSEGSLLTFTATATDADLPDQTLTYSLSSSAPSGAIIDPVSGVFTWSPSEAQGPSTNWVTVFVRDNGSPILTNSQTIKIIVTEVNTAPLLGAIGVKSVSEGNLLTFAATASDADLPAQPLSYSVLNAPAGAVINSSSGVFTWVPSEAQGPGSYLVTVRVTDNGSPALRSSEVINITVTEVNIAPVLATIGNKSVIQGSNLTFTATATDADEPAQALTYSLGGTPLTGASIHPTSGVFSWTPNAVQLGGSYSVTVQVSDGTLTDSKVVSINVTSFDLPTISISDPSPIPGGADGALVAEFEVALSHPSPFEISVDFATADDSAVAGHDYTTTSGTLVFPSGQTNLIIEVDVMGYSTIYTNRVFLVNLSHPTNATIAQTQGTGTINADPPPGLYINNVVALEGDRGVSNVLFTVSLLNASTNVVTVNYATTNGTALAVKDYRPKKGRLKFLPGVTSMTIPVTIVGNTLNEAEEFFRINLSRSVNTVIIDGQGIGTIIDNDPLPLVSIADVTTVEVNAGVRSVVFTLRLSAKSGRALNVDFATSDGTALAGTDYVATNGTALFPAGAISKKVTVGIIGDTLHEDAETFLLNLSNAVNATISDGQAIGNIHDSNLTARLGARRFRLAR